MKYLTDFLAVAGTAAVTTGVAIYSTPLAFITAGAFMILGAWLLASVNSAGDSTRGK